MQKLEDFKDSWKSLHLQQGKEKQVKSVALVFEIHKQFIDMFA